LYLSSLRQNRGPFRRLVHNGATFEPLTAYAAKPGVDSLGSPLPKEPRRRSARTCSLEELSQAGLRKWPDGGFSERREPYAGDGGTPSGFAWAVLRGRFILGLDIDEGLPSILRATREPQMGNESCPGSRRQAKKSGNAKPKGPGVGTARGEHVDKLSWLCGSIRRGRRPGNSGLIPD